LTENLPTCETFEYENHETANNMSYKSADNEINEAAVSETSDSESVSNKFQFKSKVKNRFHNGSLQIKYIPLLSTFGTSFESVVDFTIAFTKYLKIYEIGDHEWVSALKFALEEDFLDLIINMECLLGKQS
jgi:hypothetical protein